MRLLEQKSGNFSLAEYWENDIPQYAILSHTWGVDDEEVTFRDIKEGTGKSKEGYRKLTFCAKQAMRDGLEYVWIDTCCIDKSSSAELSEAINSMFRWYQYATKCYVYLSDVSISTSDRNTGLSSGWEQTFEKSRWFTRGWTLQELIAPKSVTFFSQEEERIGDKRSLEQKLYGITGITIEALRGKDLSHFSVEERMSWAERRHTKRKEDAVYCLLGIFDIQMALIYGEGQEKALKRLQTKIKKNLNETSSDVSFRFRDPGTKLYTNRRFDMSSQEHPSNATGPMSRPYLPSWQMDVPKLADTVMSLSAEGLKRLQLSGVDIHTLGCMEALGQITPASSEFRKSLLKARKDQRSERWKIFDSLVEFGSGTNYVVDLLLKTRAGENILALLTSLSSVMESGAIDTLSFLFQELQVPAESTPSLSQLENLRTVCLPLARKMDFKDRMAKIHHWLIQEFTYRAKEFVPTDALPSSGAIADLVKELHQIVLHAETHSQRLMYCGINGAAWLIVYSSQVLGLPVSLVLEDGTWHPIQGTYESASVIILPAGTGTSQILRRLSQPTDVVRFSKDSGRQKPESINWLLSCGTEGVDLLALTCGWNITDRQEIGDLVFSIAKEYVEYRIFQGRPAESTGSIPYHALRLEDILLNLRQTLRLIGLPNDLSFKRSWREENFRPVEGSREGVEIVLQMFSTMCPFTDERRSSCHHGTQNLHPKELNSFPDFCVRCKLQISVFGIAYRASCLAFTDWCRTYKKMAIGGASHGLKYFRWIYWSGSKVAGSNIQPKLLPPPEHPTLTHDLLGREICPMCTGTRTAYDQLELSTKSYLGADFDGMLLINYRALEPSLQPGPVFIIRDGEFSFCGERRSLIREAPFYVKLYTRPTFYKLQSTMNTVELRPSTDFLPASLHVEAALHKSFISLNYTLNLRDGLGGQVTVQVGKILENLNRFKTTTPCTHPVDTPLPVSKAPLSDDIHEVISWFKDDTSSLWRVVEIPDGYRETEREQDQLTLRYLHPTANKVLTQWAAVSSCSIHTDQPVTMYYLFQLNACLSCTGREVKFWENSQSSEQKRRTIIVPLDIS